jgi:hypothetical protein
MTTHEERLREFLERSDTPLADAYLSAKAPEARPVGTELGSKRPTSGPNGPGLSPERPTSA